MDCVQGLSLLSYFSDNMMFLQEKPVFIRGWDMPGIIKATLIRDSDTRLITQAYVTVSNGEFCITLEAQKASFDTYTLKVEGSSTVVIKNILFGELWVAAGQSNMENEVRMSVDPTGEIARATNPYIRFFIMPRLPSFDAPMPYACCNKLPSGCYWAKGDDKKAAANVSAVAYAFAHTLYEQLDCDSCQIPIGVINTAVGGTGIDTWLPRETIESVYEIKEKLISKNQYKNYATFNTAGEFNYCQPTVQYNCRIAPLRGICARGVLWYQGESNVGDCNPGTFFTTCLNELVKVWSTVFGSSDNQLPFIFTHIAPYDYYLPEVSGYLAEHISDAWAANKEMRAQVAIYDIDLCYDTPYGPHPIHPSTKRPVGERLSMAAMGTVYNRKSGYMSPVYESAHIEGDKIVIRFSNVGAGLKIRNGEKELLGFTIADESLVYVQAEAEIIALDTVVVYSPFVPLPKYATYAFENYNMQANLCSSLNMPAIPFRTFRTEKAQYFFDQVWLQCKDEMVWVMTNDDPTPQARFVNAWENAAPEKMQLFQDRYAVKADFTEQKASFGPVLGYDSMHTQLDYYKKISFECYPLAANAIFTGLRFVSDKAYIIQSDVRVKADQWNQITIELSGLCDFENHILMDDKEVLSHIKTMYFCFTTDKAQKIYMSKIRLHN